MAIKTEKIISELSKYDTTEELFHSFEEAKFYVVEELKKQQKLLQEKSDNIEQKINQINSK